MFDLYHYLSESKAFMRIWTWRPRYINEKDNVAFSRWRGIMNLTRIFGWCWHECSIFYQKERYVARTLFNSFSSCKTLVVILHLANNMHFLKEFHEKWDCSLQNYYETCDHEKVTTTLVTTKAPEINLFNSSRNRLRASVWMRREGHSSFVKHF